MTTPNTNPIFAVPTRRVPPRPPSQIEPVPNEITKIGPYDLHLQLGRGGMGTVYLAIGPRNAEFRRPVALKELDPMLARLPSGTAMFRDEIALASQLNNLAFPRLLDAGRDGDRLYMVSEYAAGEPLSRLRDAMRQRRRVPYRASIVAKVVADICDAVHALHEAKSYGGEHLGIIHRDLSPNNLMLTYDGCVRVLDLGIALWSQRTVETEPGFFKGKVTYTAPETLLGAAPHRSADVWSLGMVLWELLAERPVFDQGSSDLHEGRDTREIQPPSLYSGDVPAELDAVVARALAPRPDERYESADQMGQAIRRALNRSGDPTVTSEATRSLIDGYFPRGRQHHASLLRVVLNSERTEWPKPPRYREPTISDRQISAPASAEPAGLEQPTSDAERVRATSSISAPEMLAPEPLAIGENGLVGEKAARVAASVTVPPNTRPVARRDQKVWRIAALVGVLFVAGLGFTALSTGFSLTSTFGPLLAGMEDVTRASDASRDDLDRGLSPRLRPAAAIGQTAAAIGQTAAAPPRTPPTLAGPSIAVAPDANSPNSPSSRAKGEAREAREEARRSARRRRAEAASETEAVSASSASTSSDDATSDASDARTGVVIVTSDRPAAVFVGGEPRGETPARLVLPAGNKVVEVAPTDGSAAQRVAVNVQPNRARLVEVKREEEEY